MLKAERIVPVTAIGRPPAGLHVSRTPGLGADGPEESRRMEGTRAHFHVIRLCDDAAAFCPELLQRENQLLEGLHGVRLFPGRALYGRLRGAQYNRILTCCDGLRGSRGAPSDTFERHFGAIVAGLH